MKQSKSLPKGATKRVSTTTSKKSVVNPKAKKAVAPKNPVGNPPMLYDPEVAERICVALTVGQSLVQVLQLPNMPSRQVVYRWLNDSKEFRNNYARAREEQADYFADECVVISDEALGLDAAGVSAMKLRVDSRKWRAGTLKPKVYGNNAKLAIGGDEDNKEPIHIAATVSDAVRAKLKTIVSRPIT